MQFPLRCVNLFCSTKFSICSGVIEFICSLICSLFSSGKFVNWESNCSLTLPASSLVNVMVIRTPRCRLQNANFQFSVERFAVDRLVQHCLVS